MSTETIDLETEDSGPGYTQMHLRLTPDLLTAIDQIVAAIESKPSLSVSVVRRKGRLTNASVIRFALGRCLAGLEQG